MTPLGRGARLGLPCLLRSATLSFTQKKSPPVLRRAEPAQVNTT